MLTYACEMAGSGTLAGIEESTGPVKDESLMAYPMVMNAMDSNVSE